jgi:hypothetical protein
MTMLPYWLYLAGTMFLAAGTIVMMVRYGG